MPKRAYDKQILLDGNVGSSLGVHGQRGPRAEDVGVRTVQGPGVLVVYWKDWANPGNQLYIYPEHARLLAKMLLEAADAADS